MSYEPEYKLVQVSTTQFDIMWLGELEEAGAAVSSLEKYQALTFLHHIGIPQWLSEMNLTDKATTEVFRRDVVFSDAAHAPDIVLGMLAVVIEFADENAAMMFKLAWA